MRKLMFIFLLLLTGCVNKESLKKEIISELSNDPAFITDIIGSTSEYATNCTVSIKNNFSIDKESIGTGIIFERTDNGYLVLTNEHVIRYASSLEVITNNLHITPEVLKEDSELDLAILELETDEELSVCQINPVVYTIGEPIISVGTSTSLEYANTVTLGIVSRIDDAFIQHDASINNGSSGGAIFSLKREVIGLNVSKINSSVSGNEMIFVEGMSFSIKNETLVDFIND
ncbi:trypsin-like peptidase domain-containing protein [Mycoplasmatota bacterium WC44]